ncbi:MAG TPA: IPTL-CTERM sorting domain-containing protein [Thermodesulfobacteriota bacterium]|nr:IPTL-CTERM sorting domain-containing protein [Thermodesulfobacteriota bacterium]
MCSVTTEEECIGFYQGDFSICEINTCDDPVTPPPPPSEGPTVIIPTLSEWGMIIATILLGFAAVLRFRKRDTEI